MYACNTFVFNSVFPFPVLYCHTLKFERTPYTLIQVTALVHGWRHVRVIESNIHTDNARFIALNQINALIKISTLVIHRQPPKPNTQTNTTDLKRKRNRFKYSH